MKVDYYFYLVDDDSCDCLVTPNGFYDFISTLKDYKIHNVNTGLSFLHYYVVGRRIVAYIEERKFYR